MLVPFLCLMVILEEEAPCMVPIITEGKAKTLMLLAMQLEKGLKKNEMTYLEALNFTPPSPYYRQVCQPLHRNPQSLPLTTRKSCEAKPYCLLKSRINFFSFLNL